MEKIITLKALGTHENFNFESFLNEVKNIWSDQNILNIYIVKFN